MADGPGRMGRRAVSSSLPGMYRAVPAQVDLSELEHDVLGFWQERDVFSRSLEQSAGRPEWVFYEGPPTANGMPGAHHIEARVFKDVFPRYKTMKGFHVARKAGWDCHGLPVELAVEQELGFTGKPDIEAYGIAEFNAKCRESVQQQRRVRSTRTMSERMGYWADYDHAYRTMDPQYVESVWWALKQIFDKGLLVEDYRVAPYCPRCGPNRPVGPRGGSGVRDVVDPSVSTCGSRDLRRDWSQARADVPARVDDHDPGRSCPTPR